MKAYDSAEPCAKCGSDEVRVRHVTERPARRRAFRSAIAVSEHIACRCSRCGYRWQRSALDLVDLTGVEPDQVDVDQIYRDLVDALTTDP